MARSFYELLEKFRKEDNLVNFCEKIGIHKQTYWRWSRNPEQEPPAILLLDVQAKLAEQGLEMTDKQIITVYRNIRDRKEKGK